MIYNEGLVFLLTFIWTNYYEDMVIEVKNKYDKYNFQRGTSQTQCTKTVDTSSELEKKLYIYGVFTAQNIENKTHQKEKK